MITRAQHWTDTPQDGQLVRRVIKNWSNYQEPSRDWLASTPEIEASLSAPDNWEGEYDFQAEAKANPLQAYFIDATDADNSAMAGCRLANDPGSWINLKAVDVSNKWATEIPDPASYRWTELWDNTDLKYTSLPARLKEEIILRKPGHPLIFRFSTKIPDGYSLEFSGNAAVLKDSRGAEKLRLAAPWGTDSSTLDPNTIDGRKFIPVVMRRGADLGRLIVIEIILDQKDLDGVQYPVTIDPTVQISGTAAIDDTMMQGGGGANEHFNMGTNTNLAAGYAWTTLLYKSVTRLDETLIPAGTITAFRHLFWRGSHARSLQADYMDYYIIKDTYDWVEGNKAWAAADVGECDWVDAKHGQLAWGGPGCSSSGVDFDADGAPPNYQYNSYSAGPDVPVIVPLKNEWAVAWRDATRLNRGIILGPRSVLQDSYVKIYSSEDVGNPHYFEVDYAPIGGNAQRFFLMGGT